jgi:hypothetical protein
MPMTVVLAILLVRLFSWGEFEMNFPDLLRVFRSRSNCLALTIVIQGEPERSPLPFGVEPSDSYF